MRTALSRAWAKPFPHIYTVLRLTVPVDAMVIADIGSDPPLNLVFLSVFRFAFNNKKESQTLTANHRVAIVLSVILLPAQEYDIDGADS